MNKESKLNLNASDYAISHCDSDKTYKGPEVHKMLCDAYIAGNNDTLDDKDEEIRKALINVFAMHKDYEAFFGVSVEDIRAWLERQCEQNPYSGVSFKYNGHAWGMCARDGGVEILMDGNLKAFISLDKSFIYPISSQSALEAVKEEKIDNQTCVKPADKFKPEFKVGDWITDGCLHCKIIQVLDECYIVDSKFGKTSIFFKREYNYHLWSIQDARDGDILIYNDSIFIFDEIYENDLIYYGIYEHNKFHNDKYYSFLDLNTININNIYPATKEQRDTLMKAMANAGYTFDFESKELKKLGQSEVTKMSDQEEIAEIPFGAKDSELQEATYFIPKGFHAEIADDKVVIKKGEKPTAWSEEDEQITLSIEQVMNCASLLNIVPEKTDKIRTWLKSLKQRIGG